MLAASAATHRQWATAVCRSACLISGTPAARAGYLTNELTSGESLTICGDLSGASEAHFGCDLGPEERCEDRLSFTTQHAASLSLSLHSADTTVAFAEGGAGEGNCVDALNVYRLSDVKPLSLIHI